MKIGINIVLLAAILLGSCAREPIEEQHPLGAGEVQIKLTLPGDESSPSRAAGDYNPATEDALHKVQLFIYDPALTPQLFQTITFTKETPKASDNMVWDRKAGIITLRNTLTATKAYTIFAVANPDVTITPPTMIDAFQALSWDNKQPIDAPNPSIGLVMSQRVSDYIFANHDSKLEMSLTRLASKVRVKVVLDSRLTTLYPDFTFSLAPGDTAPKLQALGIPNKSFLFPPVPPVEYTTTPTGTTLAKLNEVPPSGEVGVWVMYLPEHPLLGKFDDVKDKATSFVLTLPYTIKNSTDPPVSDNYYVVTVQNPTSANPCQILRNTFYDVTVTVKALGNSIPTISGSEIEAQVLPWNSAQIDQGAGTLSVLELSNAYCKIYGDNADKIMIATATLNRTGLSGRALITRTGNGFKFTGGKDSTTIERTLTNGELDTINISTNSTFRGGKVAIKIGNEEQTITIDRDFDYGAYRGRMTIHGTSIRTDAEWCLISRQPNQTDVQTKYIQSTAPITAYINPLKITLVNTPRQAQITAVIKSTEGKETLTRTVIVQQPYIEHLGTRWATGNICLGYRPDGQRCFIIGGAHEESLRFQNRQMIGFTMLLPNTTWNNSIGAWFPSQSGPTALAVLKTGADVANSYGDLVIGIKKGNETIGLKPRHPGDPCEYIYSSDEKTIKWRTPTQAELDNLRINANHSWDFLYPITDFNQLDRGVQVLERKLFLPVTGALSQGEGRDINAKGVGDQHVQVALFSRDTVSIWDGASYMIQRSAYPEVGSQYNKSYAVGIRCVRKEIKL